MKLKIIGSKKEENDEDSSSIEGKVREEKEENIKLRKCNDEVIKKGWIEEEIKKKF